MERLTVEPPARGVYRRLSRKFSQTCHLDDPDENQVGDRTQSLPK